jgi:hypothetical protein
MTLTCVFAWASIRANRRWVASAMSASVFTAPWVLLKGAAVDLPPSAAPSFRWAARFGWVASRRSREHAEESGRLFCRGLRLWKSLSGRQSSSRRPRKPAG